MRNRVAVIAVLVAACTTATKPERDACRAVDGAVFESFEQLPYGENQQGTILHAWYVTLSAGNVDWRHDDTLHDRGTYTCTGDGEIAATLFGLAVTASYDPDSGVLVWDGHDYARCADAAECERAAGWL